MRCKLTLRLSHHITLLWRKLSRSAKSQKESFLILVSAIKKTQIVWFAYPLGVVRKIHSSLNFTQMHYDQSVSFTTMWSVNILNANSDSWCPVCSVGYWHSQTISTNMTNDCVIQKETYPIKSKGGIKKNKTIFTEQSLNCPLHPSGTSTQTSENVVWKIGQAQTCNEYISWLAETYLNIISNELWNTLYFAHWK